MSTHWVARKRMPASLSALSLPRLRQGSAQGHHAVEYCETGWLSRQRVRPLPASAGASHEAFRRRVQAAPGWLLVRLQAAGVDEHGGAGDEDLAAQPQQAQSQHDRSLTMWVVQVQCWPPQASNRDVREAGPFVDRDLAGSLLPRCSPIRRLTAGGSRRSTAHGSRMRSLSANWTSTRRSTRRSDER